MAPLIVSQSRHSAYAPFQGPADVWDTKVLYDPLYFSTDWLHSWFLFRHFFGLSELSSADLTPDPDYHTLIQWRGQSEHASNLRSLHVSDRHKIFIGMSLSINKATHMWCTLDWWTVRLAVTAVKYCSDCVHRCSFVIPGAVIRSRIGCYVEWLSTLWHAPTITKLKVCNMGLVSVWRPMGAVCTRAAAFVCLNDNNEWHPHVSIDWL